MITFDIILLSTHCLLVVGLLLGNRPQGMRCHRSPHWERWCAILNTNANSLKENEGERCSSVLYFHLHWSLPVVQLLKIIIISVEIIFAPAPLKKLFALSSRKSEQRAAALLVGGRGKKSRGKLCLFMDIYLLAFIHLITHWWSPGSLVVLSPYFCVNVTDVTVTADEKEVRRSYSSQGCMSCIFKDNIEEADIQSS